MSDTGWWWVAAAVLFLVVAPAVVVLARGLLKQVVQLNRLADQVVEHGTGINRELGNVPKLVRTRELTSAARSSVARYGGGLLRLLGIGA